MPSEAIVERLIRLDNSVKKFKQELFQISWYLRGGVSTLDLLHYYSHDDRLAMYEVIKGNVELTKDTHLPLL